MKKLSALVSLLTLAVMVPICVAADDPAAAPAVAPKDKAAYTLGVNIGKNMKESGVALELDSMMQGIKDSLAGGNLAMSDEEMKVAMAEFQQAAMENFQKRMEALAAKNKEEGEKFLDENKTKEGVVTLPSGLQYKVITEGDGKLPQSTDRVMVNYRGTLVDGTEFDSSYKGGKPADFSLAPGKLIKGMTEALLAMKVGSKWKIYVPADIAYGERGMGQKIGPNTALIFEVELVGIKEAPAAPPAKTGIKEAPTPPPARQ